MSTTTCICMDTQNGKLLNTSQTQNFDIFSRVINNDTKMGGQHGAPLLSTQLTELRIFFHKKVATFHTFL